MATSKQWITAALAHEETERVPYNFSFSPPVRARLQEHYSIEDLEEFLCFPIRMNAPTSRKPLYASPAEFGERAVDEFGVTWSTSLIDRGSPIIPALRAPDLSSYIFPDPAAAYRFAGLADWCTCNRAHYLIIWVGDLWERATFMRGMEELLLDIALHRAFVDELLERLTENILRTMEILFALADFDGIAVSDDYGTQKSLLLSPDDWRALVKPHLTRIYAAAKRYRRTVFHHSCGHITPIIGDLIDIGLDILHPIQPETMNIADLKRDFGRHLTFCGGLGTQDLLPYGTPADVRAEVRRLKQLLGVGGGYILEPGITLQDDVPVGNLVAVIEEASSL